MKLRSLLIGFFSVIFMAQVFLAPVSLVSGQEVEITPTPTEEVTPTPTEDPEVTPTPTNEPEVTPTPTEPVVTSTPIPPTPTPIQEVTPTPTSRPQPTPTPQQQIQPATTRENPPSVRETVLQALNLAPKTSVTPTPRINVDETYLESINAPEGFVYSFGQQLYKDTNITPDQIQGMLRLSLASFVVGLLCIQSSLDRGIKRVFLALKDWKRKEPAINA